MALVINLFFYGSELITGWTQYSGNIYKATFGESISQLFVDNTKMKAARFPNSGYNLYIGAGRDQEYPTLLYEGIMDEVRIYNYGLSASDVEDLFFLMK